MNHLREQWRAAVNRSGLSLRELWSGQRPKMMIVMHDDRTAAWVGNPIVLAGRDGFSYEVNLLDLVRSLERESRSSDGFREAVGKPTFFLIGGALNASLWNIAETTDPSLRWGSPTMAPDQYGHWKPSQELYRAFQSGDEKRFREAFQTIAVNIATEEYVTHGLAPVGTSKATVYRGMSLPDGVDPSRASRADERGEGDAGSSWTLSEKQAKSIATKGGAGFGGSSGDYQGQWDPHNERRNSIPTVLRAEVDLEEEGTSLYTPWTLTYAGEQEVDIRPGRSIVLTGYVQARPVAVDPTEKRLAESKSRRDFNSDEDWYEWFLDHGRYRVRWEWPDWTNTRVQRMAATHKVAWKPGAFQGQTYDYAGEVGNRTHITRVEDGTLLTSEIANMNGVAGETPGSRAALERRRGEWDEFLNDIKTNGIKEPLFITVDYGEEPKISEGNHRRDAAVELGLERVPVEVRYFGHAERG